MTGPTSGDQPDATSRDPLVLARPHPNETVEEFSARFLAEILEAQQSQEEPRSDGD